MLHHFPTEIALHAISFLPLQSLYSAILVSREWNTLITANESAVYRNVARLHRFIDEEQLVSGADAIITDWKAYCRRQLEIERGWRGKAPSTVHELTETGPAVHRIQVDYEFGFVITTCSQIGRLSVCDVKTNDCLWALPSPHVAVFAHIEYDRGYIVLTRYDSSREVWRHAIDAPNEPHSQTSPPDQGMLNASTRAAATWSSSNSRRGQFKAWALLRMPEHCRLLRLSYPNLLAVAPNTAYVWDITQSRIVLIIRDIQRPLRGFKLGPTNYAEVNNAYVFICGDGLRIFAREGGALVYQLPSRELSGATWDVRPYNIRGLTSSIAHPQILRYRPRPPSDQHGTFMACHVSASGKDLAVLTTNGRLVLLPDFQRLFAKPKAILHREIAIILNLTHPPSDDDISCYLAVGGRNGKLAVATRQGIYIVSPDLDFSRLTADRPPKPGVSVCRLAEFDDEESLSILSCLQITHDAVYFTYKPSEGGFSLTVYSVSF